MKFWEAMKALEEGNAVRCKAWMSHCFMHLRQAAQNPHMGIILWTDTSEEWELHEEPEKAFSFAEVVKGLKEGKKFRRHGMAGYLGREHLPMAQFRVEDFEANDWVEVK